MIKNNYFSIYFIILLICVTCISCDHTRGKHVTIYAFSQEFHDYTIFNMGSYWVYEDSASKAIDSIYLFGQHFSFIEDAGGSVRKQYLEEWKYSSLGPSTLFFRGYIPFSGTQGVYAESVGTILSPDVNYFDGSVGSSRAYNYSPYYEEKRDSISYQETFYQVKIFLSFHQQSPNHSRRFYYAKNIGLVRKELFNGQVWNLVRYHVSQ